MSRVSMCRVIGESIGRWLDGYRPRVYVPLKALFLVIFHYEKLPIQSIYRDFSFQLQK